MIPDHLPTECPARKGAGDLEERCATPLRYREPFTDDEPLTAVCSARPEPHEWIVVGEPGSEQLALEGDDGQPVFAFPPAQGCPLCRSPLGPEGPGSGADPRATLLSCYGHGGHRWLVDTVAGTMRRAPAVEAEQPGESAGQAALRLAADELRELVVEADRALERLDVIAREHSSPHTAHAAGVLRDVAQVALAQDLLAVQLLAVMLERLAARPDAGARVVDQRREQSYVIVLADLERRRQGPSPGEVSRLAGAALEGLQQLIVEVRSHVAAAAVPRCGSRRSIQGDAAVAVCDRPAGHAGVHKGYHPVGRMGWTDADALPPVDADEVTS